MVVILDGNSAIGAQVWGDHSHFQVISFDQEQSQI